jgi:hypothetical protein
MCQHPSKKLKNKIMHSKLEFNQQESNSLSSLQRRLHCQANKLISKINLEIILTWSNHLKLSSLLLRTTICILEARTQQHMKSKCKPPTSQIRSTNSLFKGKTTTPCSMYQNSSKES